MFRLELLRFGSNQQQIGISLGDESHLDGLDPAPKRAGESNGESNVQNVSCSSPWALVDIESSKSLREAPSLHELLSGFCV